MSNSDEIGGSRKSRQQQQQQQQKGQQQQQKPSRPSMQDMIADLASVPINDDDILFKMEKVTSADTSLCGKLEKLLLFKTSMELESAAVDDEPGSSNSSDSSLSLGKIRDEIEAVDKRLGSLHSFIEISEKFLSIHQTTPTTQQ